MKETIKKELNYCKEVFTNELDTLTDLYEEYTYWFNIKSSVAESMKTMKLELGEIADILEFSESRWEFLKQKVDILEFYLGSISNMSKHVNHINDDVVLGSMEVKMLLMLESLSLKAPEDIFNI